MKRALFFVVLLACGACESNDRLVCIDGCNRHFQRLNYSPTFQVPYQSCLNACVGQPTAFMGLVSTSTAVR